MNHPSVCMDGPKHSMGLGTPLYLSITTPQMAGRTLIVTWRGTMPSPLVGTSIFAPKKNMLHLWSCWGRASKNHLAPMSGVAPKIQSNGRGLPRRDIGLNLAPTWRRSPSSPSGMAKAMSFEHFELGDAVVAPVEVRMCEYSL